MTGEGLPIIFAPHRRDTWVVLALGLAMLIAGIAMSFDSATLVSVFGLFRVPRSGIGWLVALPGLVMVPLAINALARGLPRLELREEGIVLRRRVGGAIRVAWNEVAHVDVQRMETTGALNVAGSVKIESVAIITTNGRKVPISELGPTEEMREAIERNKTKWCVG